MAAPHRAINRPVLFSAAAITALSLVIHSEKAHAYCVFNRSKGDITAMQLPFSPSSFKQVIPPNGSKCCNFSEPTCVHHGSTSRTDRTDFAIFAKKIDTNAITADQIFAKDILPILSKAADKFIKVPIASPISKELGKANDELIKKGAAGTIATYNGGVITYYDPKKYYGCWTGDCKGQDINSDGTTGHPKGI
jgi:hypothetical protein